VVVVVAGTIAVSPLHGVVVVAGARPLAWAVVVVAGTIAVSPLYGWVVVVVVRHNRIAAVHGVKVLAVVTRSITVHGWVVVVVTSMRRVGSGRPL
jgi:hypothetical protein